MAGLGPGEGIGTRVQPGLAAAGSGASRKRPLLRSMLSQQRMAEATEITERIRPGTVFLPMHWGASQEKACEANRLMHELACDHSGQPELKAAAVRIGPLSPACEPPVPVAAAGHHS